MSYTKNEIIKELNKESLILSPNQTLEELGTKEEFENPFNDDEHNELLNEKLNQEIIEENREEVEYEEN